MKLREWSSGTTLTAFQHRLFLGFFNLNLFLSFLLLQLCHSQMESSRSNADDVLVESICSLSVQDASGVTGTPVQLPSHLTHDPENNLKRSDPFQFGSRYLNQEDNVYEFNAWDHVETDDTYKEYAEEQYAKQREAPVSDFDKSKHYFPTLLW